MADLPEYVSTSAIAGLLGISARQVQNLASNGIISRDKDHNSMFHLQKTMNRYIEYLKNKASGREHKDTESELKAQKLKAEIALKESQGELHRLRTEIALGNYIPIEEVKADYSRFFIVFKNFANGLPGKLAGKLTGFVSPVEVREIEKEIQVEVTNSLNDFVSRAAVKKVRGDDGVTPKKMGRPRKNAEKK